MEARQKSVEELFDGSYKFIIPVYQRNYEWSKIHVEQFLDDIKNTMCVLRDYRESEKHDMLKKYTYFIGSIVTYSDRGTKNLLLIDGQQRTTTICLILIALRDLLENKQYISTDESLCEKISDRLINKYDKTENRLKLKPINKDLDIYQSLVFKENLNANYKESNIYNNYQTIRKYIHTLCVSGDFTIDNFWVALTRLEFVWIELTYGTDNPQKIFESLNATGKKLEDSDLIRNYVLMNVHPDNQNEYYLKYWRTIEENCQGQKLTEFLRYFLILENKKYIDEKDVYKEFKNTYPEFNDITLKQITELSSVFKKIKNGVYDTDLVSEHLYVLDFIKFGTSLSLQMQIMSLYENNQLSKSQTNQCLELLENYFVRRRICEVPTNSLNKIMPVIVKNLSDKVGADYVNMLSENLTDVKNKFPTDQNFIDSLKNIDLYNTKNFCNYFLARIEKTNNRELVMSLKIIIHNNNITKEHIFPQQSIRWKKDITDEDYNYLKDKIHSFANLTLTAYNSDLSNKPWLEKREIFLSSAYTVLNNMLKNYVTWNKETFLKRENILIEKALDIWKRPKDNTQNMNLNNSSIVSLYDNPTSTKPRILSWNNKEISINSWRSVWLIIIQDIYDNNPEKFMRLVKEGEFGKIISMTHQNQRESHKLNDYIFIELNQSANSICEQLIKIISCFDEFDVDDVLIEVIQELEMVA